MALSEILVLVLKFSFIIQLSLLSLGQPPPNINSSFEDEQSLLSFKNSIIDPVNALQDWNSSVTFCNWSGVTCDLPRERVIELRLSGRLSRLRELWLEMNQLEAEWKHPQHPRKLCPTHTARPNLEPTKWHYSHGAGQPSYWGSACLHWLTVYRAQLLEPGNNIGGELPEQIANLTNLTYIDLSSNNFAGRIPSALGRLQNLERLLLDSNKLEASIPSEIGQLAGLGLLSLSDNMLSGRIPDAFSNLKQLRDLYLHSNHLSGDIPPSLGRSWRLEVLDLSDNKLRGKIPPEVARLQNLIYFNLSGNMLEGPLPPEVGKMEHVQEIDVSKNKLGGKIPATIESCSELQSLNLSWNALQGPIPNSLAQLKSLEDVDLSHNNLSGSIPKPFEKLGMLRHLKLSFNNFSGEIPRAGSFTNLTVTSFMGNPNLCGEWLNMPPCSTPTHNHALLKEIVIPVVSITCFIICVSLVSIFLCCRQKPKNALALNVGYPKISHRELIDATNGFNEANLLGVGSFGAVYKAIFRDGRMAAVKVLNLQNEEAHKSFSTECKVLGTVRHRNHVKIITSFSNLEFKALVMEFMPSGSLEKHLYSDNACELNLRDRVNIAIDIARAMEYLHHLSPVEVVHCDLKLANVLLDENMTARVADFGIARIICANSMDLYTSTIKVKGSVGYIAPEYGQGGMVSAICNFDKFV
eukprot:Gb_15089 [translate_table: standard]